MIKVDEYLEVPGRFVIKVNDHERLSSKGYGFKTMESAYSFIWGKRGDKTDPDYQEFKKAEIPAEYLEKFSARSRNTPAQKSQYTSYTPRKVVPKPLNVVTQPSDGSIDGMNSGNNSEVQIKTFLKYAMRTLNPEERNYIIEQLSNLNKMEAA